ncbi:MAG: hypothetical protein IKJ59_07190 [Clostridia bacterium]|nr:hypothetical protein [Clostridia bacterium]
MKKFTVVCALFVLCVFLSSCNKDYLDYYENNLNDYTAIVQYALENYAKENERVVVLLSDINDENLVENITVAEEKFSYIWVENNNVIFWDNEMKTLGLLYSEKTNEALDDIEEWYNNIDKERIQKNWYLIGQFNCI